MRRQHVGQRIENKSSYLNYACDRSKKQVRTVSCSLRLPRPKSHYRLMQLKLPEIVVAWLDFNLWGSVCLMVFLSSLKKKQAVVSVFISGDDRPPPLCVSTAEWFLGTCSLSGLCLFLGPLIRLSSYQIYNPFYLRCFSYDHDSNIRMAGFLLYIWSNISISNNNAVGVSIATDECQYSVATRQFQRREWSLVIDSSI